MDEVLARIAERQQATERLLAAFRRAGYGDLSGPARNALADSIFALQQAASEGNEKELRRELKSLAVLEARFRQLDQQQQRLELQRRRLERLQQAGQKLATAVRRGRLKDPDQLGRKLDEIFGR